VKKPILTDAWVTKSRQWQFEAMAIADQAECRPLVVATRWALSSPTRKLSRVWGKSAINTSKPPFYGIVRAVPTENSGWPSKVSSTSQVTMLHALVLLKPQLNFDTDVADSLAVLRRKSIRPHAAVSSSQYSWCSPPRTPRALIRQLAGNSCRWLLGRGRGLLPEAGTPGPKLACGRPRL
jgi:hypothetical protein